MRQFLISILVQLLFLSFPKPLTLLLATEEGYRLQDLLIVDLLLHKSKYREAMKSDQRPQRRKHDQNKHNEGVNYGPVFFNKSNTPALTLKSLHEHTLDDAALERSNPEGNRLSTIQYTTNFIGVRLTEKESFSEQSLTNHEQCI